MGDGILDFEEYLENFPMAGFPQGGDVCVLEGCRQLYTVTGNPVCRDFLLGAWRCIAGGGMESALGQEPDGDGAWLAGIGRFLLWMQGQTKEDRCGEMIEKLAAPLAAGCGQEYDGRTLYLTQPFAMQIETEYNGKAGYGGIAGRFENVSRSVAELPQQELGWFLMALVDVISCTSIEIYEHYRRLLDILKKTVRAVVCPGNARPGGRKSCAGAGESGPDFSLMLGYVVLRSCTEGYLNPEKYWEAGLELAGEMPRKLPADDKETAGISMMLEAQLLKSHGMESPCNHL